MLGNVRSVKFGYGLVLLGAAGVARHVWAGLFWFGYVEVRHGMAGELR